MKTVRTTFEGQYYDIPQDEMGSWYAYIKDLSIFRRDAGNLQIAFSDKFSKYRVKTDNDMILVDEYEYKIMCNFCDSYM